MTYPSLKLNSTCVDYHIWWPRCFWTSQSHCRIQRSKVNKNKKKMPWSNSDKTQYSLHKEHLYNKNPASNSTNSLQFHWFANILVCLIWWSLTTGNQLRWSRLHLHTWQRIKPCDNTRASWYGSDGCMSLFPDTCSSMIWWLRSKRICNLNH